MSLCYCFLDCGGELIGMSGVFFFLNYFRDYFLYVDCFWVIKVKSLN